MPQLLPDRQAAWMSRLAGDRIQSGAGQVRED